MSYEAAFAALSAPTKTGEYSFPNRLSATPKLAFIQGLTFASQILNAVISSGLEVGTPTMGAEASDAFAMGLNGTQELFQKEAAAYVTALSLLQGEDGGINWENSHVEDLALVFLTEAVSA